MANDMTDLAHWDNTVEFTGKQIAYLMLGIDPLGVSESDDIKIQPTLKTLQGSFNYAIDSLGEPEDGFPEDFQIRNEGRVALYSKELSELCLYSDPELVFSEYCKTGHGFNDQIFLRKNIVRWLSETKYESIYKFDKNNDEHEEPSTDKKPLKENSREIFLMQIAALALLVKKYAESEIVTKKFNMGENKLNCSVIAREVHKEVKRQLGLPEDGGNDLISENNLRQNIAHGLKQHGFSAEEYTSLE